MNSRSRLGSLYSPRNHFRKYALLEEEPAPGSSYPMIPRGIPHRFPESGVAPRDLASEDLRSSPLTDLELTQRDPDATAVIPRHVENFTAPPGHVHDPKAPSYLSYLANHGKPEAPKGPGYLDYLAKNDKSAPAPKAAPAAAPPEGDPIKTEGASTDPSKMTNSPTRELPNVRGEEYGLDNPPPPGKPEPLYKPGPPGPSFWDKTKAFAGKTQDWAGKHKVPLIAGGASLAGLSALAYWLHKKKQQKKKKRTKESSTSQMTLLRAWVAQP